MGLIGFEMPARWPVEVRSLKHPKTKTLAPRMSEAIANDQGFEFVLNEKERTINFTVPTKEQIGPCECHDWRGRSCRGGGMRPVSGADVG